ncbi:MAG: hypothetical protein IJ071_12760 [Ruminococcus sp.]|nr:hypothetical protein [Ruminococcus sp.]
MKGIFFRAASLITAAVMTGAFAAALSADALDFNYCDAQDDKEAPYQSFYDPGDLDVSAYSGDAKIWIDQIEADPQSLEPGGTVEVDVHVSGVLGSVASINLHIDYDSRLTLTPPNDFRLVEIGGAMDASFSVVTALVNGSCVNIGAFSAGNRLQDGVLCKLKFALPEDAKAGSLYPVGIEYVSTDYGSDVFMDLGKTDEAKLQEAYLFTKGITNGYIKISGGAEEDFLLGDVNGDTMINSSDASDILVAYSNTQTGGTTGLSTAAEKAANVNGDQYIDASDASDVLAYYAFTSTGGTGSLEEFLADKQGG